ncbi:MAG: hypothetical protein KDB03_17730 [Planctomycetales bacterium]|nr:hypothetical protein [Planctomycetales bacterium]
MLNRFFWAFKIAKLFLQLFTILSLTVPATHLAANDLEAEKLYFWDFQRDSDRDFNQFPDGWQRRRDRQHPAYVGMSIIARNPAMTDAVLEAQGTLSRLWNAWESKEWNPGYIPEVTPRGLSKLLDEFVLDNCLEISMNGGSAEIISPAFDIDPRFTYALKVAIQSEDLIGRDARAELRLYDDLDQFVFSVSTPEVTGNTNWTLLASPVSSNKEQARPRFGRVHLIVESKDPQRVYGKARFDNVSVLRLPNLSLQSDLHRQIATPNEEFRTICNVRGVAELKSEVRFQLLDYQNRLIVEESLPLIESDFTPNRNSREEQTGKPSAEQPHYIVKKKFESHVFDAQAVWNLTLKQPGLYKVRVYLGEELAESQQSTILLAAMEKEEIASAGPFGWSIPTIESPGLLELIPDLASEFGAGWIKLPVWLPKNDLKYSDQLVRCIERLRNQNVNCVGIIDEPPAEDRILFGDTIKSLYISLVFQDSKIWEPLIEPTMNRMGMRLNWFQLGSDNDLSLMSSPKMTAIVDSVRSRLQLFCQRLNLVVPWSWLQSPEEGAWNALQFATDPPLTAWELANYAAAEGSSSKTESWCTLAPLNASQYSLLDRVRDLTERTIAIRRAGIHVATVPDALNPKNGLFTEELSVGELLLPWRTLVSQLGTASYVGQVQLPNESPNFAFEHGAQSVVILWNDKETVERFFWGDGAIATDIWGAELPMNKVMTSWGFPEHELTVGPWPILIRNVDSNFLHWNLNLQLKLTNLANTLTARQNIPIEVQNAFPNSATGKVFLRSDSLLSNGVSSWRVQLGSNTQQQVEIPIEVRGDASAGNHVLRFDFDLNAGQEYKFSIFRSIVLGDGTVEMTWTSSPINEDLQQVRVEIRNNTDESVSFDCKFFPVGKPYQRFMILNATPGISLHSYQLRVPSWQPQEEIWIRCEQFESGRLLNYRLKL